MPLLLHSYFTIIKKACFQQLLPANTNIYMHTLHEGKHLRKEYCQFQKLTGMKEIFKLPGATKERASHIAVWS